MIIEHIQSIRAQAVAMVASCDLLLAASDQKQPEPPGCSHPKDSRIDTSVMGSQPSFLCQECGVTVEQSKEG